MKWLEIFFFLIFCEGKNILLLKSGGIACPYSGSWLASKNLVLETNWNLSLKMEEASFSIERQAKDLFQYLEHSFYFVNHLSGYEHEIKRRQNFQISEEKSFLLSQISVKEECFFRTSNFNLQNNFSIIVLIPFYSGRPPQVTSDLKVESIGQGNSLVNSTIKALQCLTTACSTLKYFDFSVIGVTNLRDKLLIEQTVSSFFRSFFP